MWDQQLGQLPWYKPTSSFTTAKPPAVANANDRQLKDLRVKRHNCE